jgi:hypothetical protein
MNPENSCSTITTTSVPPHCRHRTPSGRRCRMAVSDPDSGRCAKHAAEHHKDVDQADLAASLIGDIQEFRSAADINHSLGELYKLQARNKITPRRAAVMAYTASLLLRTLPAIEHETNPADSEHQRIIIDMPRPDRDWPDPEPAPPSHHAPPSHPDISWLRPNPEPSSSKDPS